MPNLQEEKILEEDVENGPIKDKPRVAKKSPGGG